MKAWMHQIESDIQAVEEADPFVEPDPFRGIISCEKCQHDNSIGDISCWFCGHKSAFLPKETSIAK